MSTFHFNATVTDDKGKKHQFAAGETAPKWAADKLGPAFFGGPAEGDPTGSMFHSDDLNPVYDAVPTHALTPAEAKAETKAAAE